MHDEVETRTIGQIAYEAYCHSIGVKKDWLEVSPAAKIAWEYSATTIVQEWLGNKYATQTGI